MMHGQTQIKLIFSHAAYDGIISSLSSDPIQKTAAFIHSLLFFFNTYA
jgi:hypothetical protein